MSFGNGEEPVFLPRLACLAVALVGDPVDFDVTSAPCPSSASPASALAASVSVASPGNAFFKPEIKPMLRESTTSEQKVKSPRAVTQVLTNRLEARNRANREDISQL